MPSPPPQLIFSLLLVGLATLGCGGHQNGIPDRDPAAVEAYQKEQAALQERFENRDPNDEY